MTDKKKPEALTDDALEEVKGGAAYLKLGDIDGESVKMSFNTVTGINPKDSLAQRGIIADTPFLSLKK